MTTPIKMRKSEEIPWQEGDGFIYLDRDGARYKIEPHSRRGVILTVCYQDGRGHQRQYASQAAAQVVVESKLRSARWVAAK